MRLDFLRFVVKAVVAVAILSPLWLTGCGVGGPGDENVNANQKPYIKSLPAPVHMSHRGGADTGPENTLEAFTIAVDTYQTHVLEIDLAMTTDGHIVVIHDATVDRTTDGTGLVKDMTLAEVQALDAAYRFDPAGDSSYPLRGQGVMIPTLDAAFALFPNTFFNLEIKQSDPPFEADLAALVELHGMEERVCWGASDDQVARRLRAENAAVCIYYPLNAASCFVLEVINGGDPLANCAEHYDALNLPEGSTTPDVVSAAHALGIPVYSWTVDDQTIMETLFSYGVDGIITDRPDTLRQVIDAM